MKNSLKHSGRTAYRVFAGGATSFTVEHETATGYRSAGQALYKKQHVHAGDGPIPYRTELVVFEKERAEKLARGQRFALVLHYRQLADTAEMEMERGDWMVDVFKPEGYLA